MSSQPTDRQYTVMRGKIVNEIGPITGHTLMEHYIIIVDCKSELFQVAVNLETVAGRPNVKTVVMNYQNASSELLAYLRTLSDGVFVEPRDDTKRLDYIRQNYVDIAQFESMQPQLPDVIMGIHKKILLAGTEVFVLGNYFDSEQYGPECREVPIGVKAHRMMGQNLPKDGLHEIHMNQGFPPPHAHVNRPFGDGGMFVVKSDGSVTGIFNVFDTQRFHNIPEDRHPFHHDSMWVHHRYREQVNVRDRFLFSSRYAMHEAALENLEKGASVNEKTICGITALHMAARNADKEFVVELLKRGANAKAVSVCGTTVLHSAVLGGDKEIIKMLLAKDRSIAKDHSDAKDLHGDTPRGMAQKLGYNEIVQLFN